MAGGIESGASKNVPRAVEDKTEEDMTCTSSLKDEEPTEEERETFRHVSDKVLWSAFLVATIESCERCTYHGLSGLLFSVSSDILDLTNIIFKGPFQNYVQNSYHDRTGLPGAIGMTGLSSPFIPCFGLIDVVQDLDSKVRLH